MVHAGYKGQHEWNVGGIFYIIQFSDFDTYMSMHKYTHTHTKRVRVMDTQKDEREKVFYT